MSLGDMPGDGRRAMVLGGGAYMRMLSSALARWPEEMCGLLVPVGDELGLDFRPVVNVADDPAGSFVIDGEAQRRHRDAVGMVHSHPHGEARPSDRDRELYVPEGWWYVVVGMMTGQPMVGAWRCRRGRLVKRQLTLDCLVSHDH